MAEQTFYWHDYETWGADPTRDRPCQFAGIRTDLEFNEIGEPLTLYCRPADDFLPHPEACLVTGITPQLALERGVPEYQFVARIHAELARPGTCAVGYNSMRFDEEVTRFMLYRNFYDPYAREYKNGNSRWDLIDTVRLCRAVRPEGIEWPEREDGSPSFKLEHLSSANGIEHGAAHDALSDVRATIALAKLLREKQPRLFDYALSLRDKKTVAQQLDWREQKPVLHISSRFPASRYCAALVMPLAPHPVNRNSVIVFDLNEDPAPLLELDAEQIRERVFASAEALPDGVARIPLKEIHLNRSPIVATARLVDDAVAARTGIDPERCRRHWELLRGGAALREKVQAVYQQQVFEPITDPDRMLYSGGFFSNSDRALIDQVRAASAEELAATSYPFADQRLPELLLRYRARNFPDSLTAAERDYWESWRRQRLTDATEGALVLAAFTERLAELRNDPQLSEEKREVLGALEAYAATLLPEGNSDSMPDARR